MKPIYANGRFPTLNTILCGLASLSLGVLGAWLALTIWRHSDYYTPNNLINLAVASIIAPVTFALCVVCAYYLIRFSANHLSGRELIGDTTRPISIAPTAYAVTSAYVLPYAYNAYDRAGDPYCDLHISYSYADLVSIRNRLRAKTYCYLRILSLPGHLGRRMPFFTRHAVDQILRDIGSTAASANASPEQFRAVVRFSFSPSYSASITLPPHQVFLSHNIISELLASLSTPSGYVPPDSSLIVGVDVGASVTLSVHYLREAYERIAAPDEYIHLPLAK